MSHYTSYYIVLLRINYTNYHTLSNTKIEKRKCRNSTWRGCFCHCVGWFDITSKHACFWGLRIFRDTYNIPTYHGSLVADISEYRFASTHQSHEINVLRELGTGLNRFVRSNRIGRVHYNTRDNTRFIRNKDVHYLRGLTCVFCTEDSGRNTNL